MDLDQHTLLGSQPIRLSLVMGSLHCQAGSQGGALPGRLGNGVYPCAKKEKEMDFCDLIEVSSTCS